jgi:hypothetical protein
MQGFARLSARYSGVLHVENATRRNTFMRARAEVCHCANRTSILASADPAELGATERV